MFDIYGILFITFMSIGVILCIAQLCVSFYDKGYNTGYFEALKKKEPSKTKKTTKKK